MNTYDKSFAGRLRTNKQYHKNQVAKQPLTALDNLTARQLEAIWNNQNGICPCCGLELDGFENSDISHISKGFFFNAANFQMLHHGCNKAQSDLTLAFVWIWKMWGECLLDLLANESTRDWTIEQLNLQPKDVARFDRRIENIRQGKV